LIERQLDISADLDIAVGGRRMRLTGDRSQLTLTTNGRPAGAPMPSASPRCWSHQASTSRSSTLEVGPSGTSALA
jgi:hypothetical protein